MEIYQALERKREAGHVLVYLQRFADAIPAFLAEGSHSDAARCRELWARGVAATPQADALHREAAARYAECGMHVHAALSYVHARATAEARAEWRLVARDPRISGKPYEQALCHFNLGLAAREPGRGEAAASDGHSSHFVQAQQLLEELADDFEARGERERAFDCYCLLLQLGREQGSFENVAEGYINCIRVLKEDGLKFYALQYYEDFLRIALEREEFHAAAAVFREAGDFSRRAGLPYDRGYLQRSAETWWLAAEKNERDGGVVELSENALHAAIDAFAALGDFHRVGQSYRRLAALDLSDAKRERYGAASGRYPAAPMALGEVQNFPDYLRHQHAYPPIWEYDLVEWELDGDYAGVCASILGDARQPGMVRRQALQLVLLHLDGVRAGVQAFSAGESPVDALGREEAPVRAGMSDPPRLAEIAQGLGELLCYAALRPLERLYRHPHPLVRRGVMKALQRLYFKRTFLLLGRGLRDAAPEVRDAAVEALESLHFPHAFDPLARIFREHPDHAVKVTALTSIGNINTLEAGEFLIEVLRYETEGLRDVARQLLTRFENPEIFPLLRRHMEMESGPARIHLEQVLRQVGHALR